MTGAGLVIISAKGANAKSINRLLLHLRDWEFDSGDRFAVLRTRDDASDRNLPVDQPPVQSFSVDRRTIQDPFENQWEGLSIEDIENYMLIKDDGHGSTSLFLLVDDQGVKENSVIIFSRALNPDGDTLWLPAYYKARVPSHEVYGMWCNLDIANMGFQEFCDQEVGQGENHWWAYRSVMGPDHYVEYIKQRDHAIRELEKLDMA